MIPVTTGIFCPPQLPRRTLLTWYERTAVVMDEDSLGPFMAMLAGLGVVDFDTGAELDGIRCPESPSPLLLCSPLASRPLHAGSKSVCLVVKWTHHPTPSLCLKFSGPLAGTSWTPESEQMEETIRLKTR